MKKVALSFSILAIAAVITFSCKKDNNVAPVPDKELQSSIDISYGVTIITDLESICAYIGENQLYPTTAFWYPSANSTGSVVSSRDTTNKLINEAFNTTTCLDGRVRDGSIFMNFDNPNPNSFYYHDYGFKGKVSLSNYKVDGWKIKTVGGSYITIENLLTAANYSPQTTNISWRIAGNITLQHPTDSTKNMHLNFNLIKTLLNTSTPTVFPVTKLSPITWSLATLGYKGGITGETSAKVPFNYVIDDAHQLYKNFSCSPDKVYGISLPSASSSSVTPRVEQYHPFINGSASFTTSTLYPRVIYYGPQDPQVDNGAAPCDNSGEVMIKGISYPIDFVKQYK